jgi:hypothetical protein
MEVIVMKFEDLIEVTPTRVYLTSYYNSKKEEVIFEELTSRTDYFLVMNGPVPIRDNRAEQGVKIYRVPDGWDPFAAAEEFGGYVAKGKALNEPLQRKAI